MSISDWIKGIFDAPSRRRDADYSKEVSSEAIFAVLLLYRDHLQSDYQGQSYWMPEVVGEMAHLHHALANADRGRGLDVVSGFLLHEQTPASAFLDFLEISLRHWRAPNNDNDFVNAVNRVLEEYDSPYVLSRFVRRDRVETGKYGNKEHYVHFDAYPRAYLRQDDTIQKEAIEPALQIFSDPAYESPAKDFRTALDRHRIGDYDGCVTASAAAVEGTIKVVAKKNKWKAKGNGLDTVAQSFISKSSLPDTVHTSFRPLADWRNTKADAHGHAGKENTSEQVARHLLATAASLVVLVQSELKQ